MLPAFFSFLKIDLAIQGLLYLYMNFRIFFLISIKNASMI